MRIPTIPPRPPKARRPQMMIRIAALCGALELASLCAAAQYVAPTDPQIAAIVVTANQVDIDAGKLAETRTRSQDVKAFAQQMVTDHSSVNQAAEALGQKLGVTPEP